MDNHDESVLTEKIKKELIKRFKKIDDEILNYLIGVINLNKDDFETIDDIQDAVGSILTELNDGGDDRVINDLCSLFYSILRP